ncbi:hypothetical protein [Actinoplanes sp. L3-i22]|uniref:hypothetical protein n=1 Tax=Actinoplanes sp. L3-i22 TaxID=2836373 RepID=UPI001C843FE8|nr:hypothetical protein [Actinoplanes sp. L3-i22]
MAPHDGMVRHRSQWNRRLPERGQHRLPHRGCGGRCFGRTSKSSFDLRAGSIDSRLLHDDAKLSMPPLPMWLHGRDDVAAWMADTGRGCRGSRLMPVVANGLPAFGQYRPGLTGTGHEP